MLGVLAVMEALKVRNFRLLFISQGISVTGTSLQDVAQAWLVLQLSSDYTALGIVVAFQYLPMLLFGAWGGEIVDRFDRRRLLFVTDAFGGLLALILAILVISHSVQLWHIYVLALCVGFVNLINQPAGQSILGQLVGEKLLIRAVDLTLSAFSISRVVGPILAGLLLETVGFGVCFVVNAASYLVSLGFLAAIRPAEMYPVSAIARQRGQVRAGLAYVRSSPNLRITLILVAVIGIFVFNYQFNLATLAKGTFGTGPSGFALLFSCFGVGGGIGSLLAGRKSAPNLTRLGGIGILLGVGTFALAASPNLVVAAGLSLLAGVVAYWFVSTSADLLQVTSHPEMRGRVMALWFIGVVGSFAIGSPFTSWVANMAGPRASLAVSGAVALASCGIVILWARHRIRAGEPALGSEEARASLS